MSELPCLTAAQKAVVEHAVDARVIVTAGPGTGKTHTLVSRIEHLIVGIDELAGQDILSLSFSRAAVGELQRRVARLSGRGTRVRSATFDSFATRLLQAHGDTSLEGTGYDRRIELATELVRTRRIDALSETRHILVDEAQDLTGIRADFVLALIKTANCGFTVFADQAQAVYTFSDKTPDMLPFVQRLASEYSDAKRLQLTTNHRTTNTQLLRIAELGENIRESPADRARVIDQFDRTMRNLPSAGSLEDAALMLSGDSNTAVLTRRNSEALSVSQVLHNAGVNHRLRRRADDPVIGDWLSRVQRESLGRRIARDDLEAVAHCLPWTPAETWSALTRVIRPRRGIINLDQVAEHLATHLPPDELLDNDSAGVVVSSIHRAKGLEFDAVLLVPFDIDVNDWLDEARVMYVGLTRARRDLMTLRPVDDRRWSYIPSLRRWRRVGFAGKRRYTTGMEISGADAVTFDTTGATRPRLDVTMLSDYLLSGVRPGDPVALELRNESSGLPVYDVVHEGHWVAATTPVFGEAIARQGLRASPRHIEGCRVEAISTVALTAFIAESYGAERQLLPNCRIQGVGTWA